MDRVSLSKHTIPSLRVLAAQYNVKIRSNMRKNDIITTIIDAYNESRRRQLEEACRIRDEENRIRQERIASMLGEHEELFEYIEEMIEDRLRLFENRVEEMIDNRLRLFESRVAEMIDDRIDRIDRQRRDYY